MGLHDYELTDAQYTQVHTDLPRVAELALAILVCGFTDGFFDSWAGGLISCADVASWGDEAIGLGMTDMAEKYEKIVASNCGRPRLLHEPTQMVAEARGALLRAGSLLIAANNGLIPQKKIDETFTVASEKLAEAEGKIRLLGLVV